MLDYVFAKTQKYLQYHYYSNWFDIFKYFYCLFLCQMRVTTDSLRADKTCF